MSEVQQFVSQTLLRHIGAPLTDEQRAQWEASVQRAYQELWVVPAFQAVLEHWIVGVLLAKCPADPGQREEFWGRREQVLDVFRLLADAQQDLPMHIQVQREEPLYGRGSVE